MKTFVHCSTLLAVAVLCVRAAPQGLDGDGPGASSASASASAASSGGGTDYPPPIYPHPPPPHPPCATCGGRVVSVQKIITIQPPPKVFYPPPQTYQPPERKYLPPPGTWAPPPYTWQPPPYVFQPPPYRYQPKPLVWKPPPVTWQPPPQTFYPPEQVIEFPPQEFHPPPQSYQPPEQSYQPPPTSYQPPEQLIIPPPIRIDLPPQEIPVPSQTIVENCNTCGQPPAPPTCTSCPCYWCRGQFNSWQRPPPNAVASASSSASSSWSNSLSAGGGDRPYYDVGSEAAVNVKDNKTACLVFIEQFADKPIEASKLVQYINQTFYGDAKKIQKNKNGIDASTFHCCHDQFGKDFFPGQNQAYSIPLLPQGESCDKLVRKLYEDVSGDGQSNAKKPVQLHVRQKQHRTTGGRNGIVA